MHMCQGFMFRGESMAVTPCKYVVYQTSSSILTFMEVELTYNSTFAMMLQ